MKVSKYLSAPLPRIMPPRRWPTTTVLPRQQPRSLAMLIGTVFIVIAALLVAPWAAQPAGAAAGERLLTVDNSRTDGFVLYDIGGRTHRQWVDDVCRQQLINNGAVLELVNYSQEIGIHPKTTAWKTCDQLIGLFNGGGNLNRQQNKWVFTDRVTQVDRAGGSLQLICSSGVREENVEYKKDDPIVSPDNPGNADHWHMFVGNLNVNAASNNDEGDNDDINFSRTTRCPGGGANMSGYWVPILYNSVGKRTAPDDINIYYKRGPVDSANMRRFPDGLKMIAGNGDVDSLGRAVTEWRCFSAENIPRSPLSKTIPVCEGNETLKMFITFPQCSNGQPWAAGQSHVKYPENIRLAPGQQRPLRDPNGVAYYRECPNGYFAMPEVSFQFHWDNVGSTEGWYLDSDRDLGAPGMSLHGDWMNAWEPSMMQSIVDNCIKESLLCINQISANKLLVH